MKYIRKFNEGKDELLAKKTEMIEYWAKTMSDKSHSYGSLLENLNWLLTKLENLEMNKPENIEKPVDLETKPRSRFGNKATMMANYMKDEEERKKEKRRKKQEEKDNKKDKLPWYKKEME